MGPGHWNSQPPQSSTAIKGFRKCWRFSKLLDRIGICKFSFLIHDLGFCLKDGFVNHCFSILFMAVRKVWTVSFWMIKYGSKTPKRTKFWSNSPQIRRFITGRLKLGKRDRSHTLAKTYVDSQGRKRFTGKRGAMRASAYLIHEQSFFGNLF